MAYERERDLYAPLKAYFEAQGYEVKGEVGAADMVARRGDTLAVVEMKLRLSLTLYHQACARLRLTDQVWIAVPRPGGRKARRVLRENLVLCRRLGLGFLTLAPADVVEMRCAPGPYVTRRSRPRALALAAQFDRLQGDPNDGGATRHGLVTAYRQEALRCAAYLAETGPEKGAIVARATGVAQATRIMRDNHYGWFIRVEAGVYALTDKGRQGLADWGDAR